MVFFTQLMFMIRFVKNLDFDLDSDSKLRHFIFPIKAFTKFVMLSILLTVSAPMSATKAFAVNEQNFPNQLVRKVYPFYNQGTEGDFLGVNGIHIRYKKWENPEERGAIVVVPGRGDAFGTYAETIYDLSKLGYSIYTLDHRGQGESGRILTGSQAGHVDYFSDYVADFSQFMKTVVKEKPHQKIFIVAHSMGGAISTVYVANHQASVDALILVAPMFKINTAPYAPGKKYFNPQALFQGHSLTQSEALWDFMRDTSIENNVMIGGPINR